MCGITGLLVFHQKQSSERLQKIRLATDQIASRGPDAGNYFTNSCTALGHRRLSIIDVSDTANQPFYDHTGRYIMVFNGEIFNYQELRARFLDQHWQGMGLPKTHSDTEVLLYLLIHYGSAALSHLSGFFSLAFFDTENSELLLARDRFGKKPLLYYRDEEYLAFASEMKALVELGIPKHINYSALLQYLQLNYIPQPQSIFEGVAKLPPGSYLRINAQNQILEEGSYYPLGEKLLHKRSSATYEEAKQTLVEKMDHSVQERMIADVPLGAFLSGGIDSSVIVGLASRHTDKLSTFSIGYADYPYFDETHYARLVADKFKTDHTVFSLRNQDVSEQIFNVLDYLDEPFADSSAIPLYILCKNVSKHVTVALSGDGGDEVFAGYNKHRAELRMRQSANIKALARIALPVLETLPKSRRNKLTNIFRQVHRYAYGATLDVKSRYWLWASTFPEARALPLLSEQVRSKLRMSSYNGAKGQLLQFLQNGDSLEDYLATDIGMVLLSDMLVKVDLMSMANSLEVRSPFLDYQVVEFAFSLPTSYKINKELNKRIVQDAFREMLPAELYNRPKRGFEIPLLDFLKTEFRSYINDELLAPEFIRQQGIFAPDQIEYYRRKLFSVNPEDVSLIIWNLIVFQHWYQKYCL